MSTPKQNKMFWRGPKLKYITPVFFQFCDVATTLAMFTRGIHQIWLQVRLEESRKKIKNLAIYFNYQLQSPTYCLKYWPFQGFFSPKKFSPFGWFICSKKKFLFMSSSTGLFFGWVGSLSGKISQNKKEKRKKTLKSVILLSRTYPQKKEGGGGRGVWQKLWFCQAFCVRRFVSCCCCGGSIH